MEEQIRSSFFNPSGTIPSRTRRPAARLPATTAALGPSAHRSPAGLPPGGPR